MSPATGSVRVASVQFAAQATATGDAFFDRIATYVRSAGDYGADFVCFPEHFTLQLLSAAPTMVPADEAIHRLTEYTPRLKERLSALAKEHSVNIVGGSHATVLENGEAHNITYVALRDGTLHARHKLHPTPDEKAVWNIQGGESAEPVETDRGQVGVMICYDSEFPLLGRALADCDIIAVPSVTEALAGYWRVRIGSMARALENQCVTAMSSCIGPADWSEALGTSYGAGGIFCPPDVGFPSTGVLAAAEINVPGWTFAEVDIAQISHVRADGVVLNRNHW